MKCPECGTENENKNSFCSECGYHLRIQGEKIKGALCYFLGWLSGIYFLLTEKDNEFIKFHAIQSFELSLIMIAMTLLFSGSSEILGLTYIIYLVLSVFLMYKAYEGQIYKLPVTGEYAERHSKD